ncbi:MAG: serine/threonine-protein kinase, partial [Bryobacteraceae bacterium]
MTGREVAHYRIESKLGAGGMGEVFLARDTRLGRLVALKILPPDLVGDADRLRRFHQEARAASALNHPNVATIYEIGEKDGVNYLAMEYVEGTTLSAHIGGKPLAVREAIEIAAQMAGALEEAWAKEVVHRDIKSANLMITPRGQVKVLDFGLAKFAQPRPEDAEAETEVTRPGVVLGTIQYMSPEQALGREVDGRSDLFSLGVVLYQMLTGRLPFAAATSTETLHKLTSEAPEAIARWNYEAPAEIERIVRKCLEKDRERRYQSPRELTVDLRNLQRDLDSGPRDPAVTAGPSRRWLLAAAVAAVVLIASAAWLLRPRREGID